MCLKYLLTLYQIRGPWWIPMVNYFIHYSNVKISLIKLVSHWDASNLRLFRDLFETRFGDRNTTLQT